MKEKIPEIKRSLELVRHLQERQVTTNGIPLPYRTVPRYSLVSQLIQTSKDTTAWCQDKHADLETLFTDAFWCPRVRACVWGVFVFPFSYARRMLCRLNHSVPRCMVGMGNQHFGNSSFVRIYIAPEVSWRGVSSPPAMFEVLLCRLGLLLILLCPVLMAHSNFSSQEKEEKVKTNYSLSDTVFTKAELNCDGRVCIWLGVSRVLSRGENNGGEGPCMTVLTTGMYLMHCFSSRSTLGAILLCTSEVCCRPPADMQRHRSISHIDTVVRVYRIRLFFMKGIAWVDTQCQLRGNIYTLLAFVVLSVSRSALLCW